MKKSVVSFIAVLLLICFLGVTAVTGVYIPGGWTMPFRNAETTQSDSADTQSDAAASDSTDTSADTTTGSADTAQSADTTAASSLKAIIPSVLDTDNGIRLGLDLVGGSRIVYEAEIPDGYNQANLADDMNSVQKVIRQRLTDKGFTEATVTLTGDNRVTVEIPQITNPEEAVQTLGTTAQLTFIDADGKEWLTGSDIKKATYGYGRPTGNEVTDVHYVQVQFTSEGQKKFAEATGNIAARTDGTNIMAIVMDNQVISSPSVSSQIDSDSCVISGSFTRDSASELADLINAGQIPFSLKQVELRSVGPQLGADAMRTSLIAGADRHRARYAVHADRLPHPGSRRFHRSVLLHGARGSDLQPGTCQPVPAGHRGHHPVHRHGGRRERHHLRARQGRAQERQDRQERDRLRLQACVHRDP